MNTIFARVAPRSRLLLSILTLSVLAALSGTPAGAQGTGGSTILAGQTVQGTLAVGDERLPAGEYVDTYFFNGTGGQRITITLRSAQFDAYLGISGPNNFFQENDDAATGSTDAGLTVVLPATGSYAIYATSYAASETGSYSLQVVDPNAPTTPPPGTLVAGQTVQGTLAAGDERLNSGEYVDTYRFNGTAGQRITITMRSTQFDAYLGISGPNNFLQENDDAESGSTDAGLNLTLPATGVYTVLATSYAAGETGSYTLQLVDPTAANTPPPQASGGLSFGQTVQGSLATTDQRLNSGEYFDTYTFNGTAGQRVTIAMRSLQFDTYLGISGPNNYSQENDDAESGSTDAALNLTLPATGTYTIVATSYAAGKIGNYTLQLLDPNAAVATTPQTPGALSLGQPVQGTLAVGDERLSGGEYIDTWNYTGRAGERIVISLESNAFDTYLMVRGGTEEDNDDDPAARGSTNSRIEVTLPTNGTYLIHVTSYAANETGAYTLRLTDPAAGAALPAAGSGTIAVGQSVSGRLGAPDPQLATGEFFDGYTLTGRRGEQLEIRLDSSDFDPYLQIMGPGSFSEYNDDDAEGTGLNSRLVVTLPEDGAYTVYATSYAGGETGNYQLRVATAQPGQAGGGAPSGTSLQIGGSVSGQLATGDETLAEGEFLDRYTFAGQAGQRVTISMASNQFDTYLLLRSPSGANEYNDDAVGGNTTNSILETILAETGIYTIGATSYAGGETGVYTLQIGASAAATSAAGGAQSGRVFAVMVGIADYPGTSNDLPYTDEDAIKLAQSLRDSGVLAEQSVLLVNGQATRQNIVNAFQQVAAAAGPNDTFLFFYSGHGNQRPAAVAGNEPDGRDETIVAVDGEITDDEMAALFRNVRAGTSIIALDACFSGGFARDVVAVPGVMGLFSSEEDLTSSVADKFQAGGYLSLFLRTGLAGAADENRDRIVTAGELSVYLRLQFNEHVTGVGAQTLEGQRNYQFLVVDRGGVRVDDGLLALR